VDVEDLGGSDGGSCCGVFGGDGDLAPSKQRVDDDDWSELGFRNGLEFRKGGLDLEMGPDCGPGLAYWT
jgi:hypothetical protein